MSPNFKAVDDKPQYPDHDFPHPGYLLIPSGYMQIASSSFWYDYGEMDSTCSSDEECMTVAEENASANCSVESKHRREDSSVVNVHLNGCDKTSSNGSTVNRQTSNSDRPSDGMVNLQPMHLEMVQHQILSQAVVITHPKVHCQVVVTGIQSLFLQLFHLNQLP